MNIERWWPAWEDYKTRRLLPLKPASITELEKTYSQLIVEPIHQIAKFPFPTSADLQSSIAAATSGDGPPFYTAVDNPTTNSLEENLARIETHPLCDTDDKWRDNVRGLAFACGAGAITGVLLELTDWMKSGRQQCVMVSQDTYTSATMMMEKLKAAGIDVVDVPATKDGFRISLQHARQQGHWVRAVYLETPSHKYLQNHSIKDIATITTRERIPLIVDSTLATPYCMQPLLLGADIVIHSTTKYINGMGDRLGGAVIGPREFVRPTAQNEGGLVMTRRLLGSIPSVVDSNSINENLKTLPTRMREHCEKAQRIAGYLSAHPKIKRVNYPSVVSHSTREKAFEQMREFGAIMTINTESTAARFHEYLRVFKHAVSYGDEHSLVLVNAQEENVRLSIGREPLQDLIDDLSQALARQNYSQ